MSLRKTLCCFVPAKKKSYSGHLYHKVDQNMLARSDEKKWQESKWRDDERNGERSDEKRHREGYSDEKRHREGYNDEQRHREQAKHYRGPHDDDKRHFERNDDYRRSSRSAKWHDEGNFHSQRSDGDRFERNNDKRSSRRSNSRPFVEREPQIISTSSEALLEIDDVGYAKILKPPKTPKVGLRSHGIDSDSTWKKEHGIEGTLKKDSRDNGTMSRGYGTKEDGKFRMNESTKDDSTLKRETLERSAQKPVDSTVISTQPREYRTKLPEAPELPQPRLKPNSDEDEMAMIARVKPYQASKDENPHSHYQFEDVTDDPKYQEKKLPDLEGALVEYCRIDHNKQKPQPQVLQSHTVVSARSQVDSFGGSPKARPQAAIWAADRKLMAHIIDVDVGQPCSNSAKCQCYGFRPHPWRTIGFFFQATATGIILEFHTFYDIQNEVFIPEI
ncbi:unnamed protein product [Bursaphelenchus okinawaensis]|uniref:Uncharacterized protein n=1 Tax=Bursaphelenchus okinawaensis TaxID=465554 RepID=A0A811JUK1_9BILA|nr:unnamed protein product [Bursaphelenchus okinawaensis]CAG9083767.1 unnamed protein product [Bursaphelenchus okinawaensis]